MQLKALGSSGLRVTEICLGTMTWGMQNSESEAHEQLDYAIKERGINFIDTAEVYPVPSSDPSWKPGTSERFIGNWLAANPGIREKLVIATKVSGFIPSSSVASHRYDPPREGKSPARLDAESVLAACDGSLRRLQTSYIDLYQVHWPDRYVPLWGSRAYDPSKERADSVPISETARALKLLLDAGKIRAYGLSNESSFGLSEWCRAADALNMPRPSTIQNQFCLLDRSFEGHLAEACAPSNNNVGLLPWSVLAGGALTGKYLGKIVDGQVVDPTLKDTRFGRYSTFMARFCIPRALEATQKYAEVAKEAGISLATLSQAFCKTRWFIPSTIIGATSMSQLKENIDAFSVDLSEEVLQKIDRIHESHLDPCACL